jgi:hypothetical protein
MTLARTGAALAAVLVATAAPAAVAAKPKPKKPVPTVCRLVTDAGDDASLTGADPSHAPLDIVSGDIATGARNQIVVLRLKSLATDPALLSGVTYKVTWTAGGLGQSMTLFQYADGAHSATFDANTETGAAGESTPKVLVDPATSTITWTITRKTNPALAKPGAKFTGIEASTQSGANVSNGGFTFNGSFGGGDTASGKSYTDRTPSCVKGV